MHYYLFLDESGDHGLNIIDPNFPVFILCGILVSHPNYTELNEQVIGLKSNFWGTKKVILHSSDIRKCEKEFKLLLDGIIKAAFYEQLDEIMANGKYAIICSCVHKERFISKYGRLADNIYNISVSNIIERAVFYMDDIADKQKQIQIIIEKRGSKEDQLLSEHLQKVMSRGTFYVGAVRIKNLISGFTFHKKTEDISGLQLSDLAAYPIARYTIDPQRANPAFDLIESKFYKKAGQLFGYKVIP